jgi:hypothetical protein
VKPRTAAAMSFTAPKILRPGGRIVRRRVVHKAPGKAAKTGN